MLERLERDDDELAMLEPYLLNIAGMMRISAAIPFLLKRLDDGDPFVAQCAQEGLEQLGGDEVVEQIALAWPAAEPMFRVSASGVLESIHTDRSAEVCLRFFADEEDGDVQEFLVSALLGGMVPDALGPIRELILGEKTGAARFFKAQLVAASTIMGVSFPEYDEWYREAAAADWYDGPINHRLRDDFVEDEEGFEGFDDDLDDDEWDDEDFEDEDFEGWDVEGWVADLEEIKEQFNTWTGPARSRKTAGRNDPCPCGSGKKYKKCCLKKQAPPPEKPATEKDLFPVGTIALYGPNDRRTTKIAASVIRFPSAEPLLKRWVAANVTDSPRVRQEILDFFRLHGVKSVVASDGNLGCPHEEGLDFPEGGDCPFCPFWKGKQGSGATDPYW
ncbi:MAG: SEC-C domain-containing protein [Thermoguttaceae bacterium]|nr:SEC-C domain-containing protein [Thermoguttaceae bacterium]